MNLEEEQDDKQWKVGEVRRAVLKKNTKKGYDNVITYAPDGRVVILINETQKNIKPGDIAEIYITEEKSRSYYAKVLKINKTFTEIKKLAEKKGEIYEQKVENILNQENLHLDLQEKLDDLAEEISELKNTLNTVLTEHQPPQPDEVKVSD